MKKSVYTDTNIRQPMQFSVWMIWNGNTTLYKGNTGASITAQPATHLIVHFAGECHHTNWKPMLSQLSNFNQIQNLQCITWKKESLKRRVIIIASVIFVITNSGIHPSSLVLQSVSGNFTAWNGLELSPPVARYVRYVELAIWNSNELFNRSGSTRAALIPMYFFIAMIR